MNDERMQRRSAENAAYRQFVDRILKLSAQEQDDVLEHLRRIQHAWHRSSRAHKDEHMEVRWCYYKVRDMLKRRRKLLN